MNTFSHALTRHGVGLAACLSALLVVTGCSVLRTPQTHVHGAGGAYETVRLTYQDLSDSTVDAVPLVSQKTRTLSIQYPHPSDKPGMALIELVVEKPKQASQPSGMSVAWLDRVGGLLRDNMPGVAFADGVEQAWKLDVAISEVDRVVQTLDRQGYFSETLPMDDLAAGQGSHAMAARVNGLAVDKCWQSSPELEDLIGRVRRDGTLVSHNRPVERVKVPRSGVMRLPRIEQAAAVDR